MTYLQSRNLFKTQKRKEEGRGACREGNQKQLNTSREGECFGHSFTTKKQDMIIDILTW